MDDDEHGGDPLPLALLGASALSLVQAASTSPSASESTRTRDVAFCRVHASASPLGDVSVGLASPSGTTVGPPPVRDIASPGSPYGSPAGDVTDRAGPPEWISRGCSPPICIAAPPGSPHGSPAGVCAAWPCSPACYAAPPGSPPGSPAGASVDPRVFFGPDPFNSGVKSVDAFGPSQYVFDTQPTTFEIDGEAAVKRFFS
jgi:hypothetical protein